MNPLTLIRNSFLCICLLGFVLSVTPVAADVVSTPTANDTTSTIDTSVAKEEVESIKPTTPALEPEQVPMDRGAPPEKENVPGGTFMLVAYILMWLCPLGFLWGTHRKVVRLEGQLAELRAAIDKTVE